MGLPVPTTPGHPTGGHSLIRFFEPHPRAECKEDLQMGGSIRFDASDKAALAALDTDFAIDVSGEIATVSGEMTVEITRPASDDGARFLLKLKFPSGETLDVRMARAQLLHELGVAES
jgi:hypothetical protein